MLLFFLLLSAVTVARGINECDHLVEVKNNEVKELLNPHYPLTDHPGKKCTWSIVADLDRRIVLECSFNDESDTRTDKRKQCGAEMSIWDAGGNPTTFCRDQTFARLGTSNRIFINYKNDDGNFYNRTSGFKCFLYATTASLLEPFNIREKQEYHMEPFDNCDFFIKLNKYDIVRLASSEYTEDREKWRRCRWTAVSPWDSKISITCPYTEKPPGPVLIQAEPCTSEFTIRPSQSTQFYQCSDRAFSETSSDNKIVLEELSIRRLPSRDFECYVHSESPDYGASGPEEASPFSNCDHIIELNDTFILKSPNNPEYVEPGSTCRWVMIAPEHYQISVACSPTKHSRRNNPIHFKLCPTQFNITLPTGQKIFHCQDLELNYYTLFALNWMTITYSNPRSRRIEPFVCTISAHPDVECKNCTEITQSKLIRIKKRELKPLLSPNYPEKALAGSTGSWTVVADQDRRIVLVCPFHHTVKTMYKPEDKAPCNGQFKIYPDNEEDSRHCQDRGFSRTGYGHIMVITYKNQRTEPLDAFKCYAYAELKERWDKLKNVDSSWLWDYDGFDYAITLDGVNMTTLVPPSAPEDEKKPWRSRWNISAVNEGLLTIACHFTNKPPAPLTIQVAPCYSQFTVFFGEGNVTHHCRKGAFSQTSTGPMILTYENLQKRPADNFLCVAYASNRTVSNEDTPITHEKNTCDYVINLDRRKTIKFESTDYDIKKNSSRSTCRWTITGPPDSRIAIVCPLTPATVTPNPSACQGQLTVLTEGRNKTLHCSEITFSRTSDNNRMVLIYENEFSESIKPFDCEIYAMENEQKNVTRLIPTVSGHIRIPLTATGEAVESPNYPKNEPGGSTFTYTAEAPQGSRIILSCPSLEQQTTTDINSDSCLDAAYFIVSSEGNPNLNRYCHRSAFVHTSSSNTLKIVYFNPSTGPSERFICNVRPLLPSPWNECDTCNVKSTLPYENCDQFFNLNYHTMTDLKLPKNYQPGSSCRWTVVSPPDSRVLVSCPENDIKPNGNNPCSSYYTVSSADKQTTHCRSEILNEPSPSNWSILTYENPSRDTVKRFICFAYVEKLISSEPCVDCDSVEKLDYSSCNISVNIAVIGPWGTLETPNHPNDVTPGVPCLWTVRSPPMTSISLTCDLGAFADATSVDGEFCRGLVTVYLPGKDPQYKCRHVSFGAAAADNKLMVTYGNQHGLSPKGFQCHVRAVNSTCHNKIRLGHLQYNEFYKIKGPSWSSSVVVPTSCTYAIESPVDTRIFLLCVKDPKRNESMAVNTAGDQETADSRVFRLKENFKIVSDRNKMTLLYILDETSKSSSDTNCRVYVDRAKLLGPECNCGNKYNKFKNPTPPIGDTVRGPSEGTWSHADKYPMVGAIFRETFFKVFCVATIISNYHAISTANCYDGDNAFITTALHLQRSLLIGRRTKAADGRSSQRLIGSYNVHYKYDKNTRENDIAISFLTQPIFYDVHIQPVCLPIYNRERSLLNERVTLLGWQQFPKRIKEPFDTNHPHLNEDIMIKLDGLIISGNCHKEFDRNNPEKISCVSFPYKSKKQKCPDDKGGHVYWKDPKTGLIKLIGLVIGKSECNFIDNSNQVFHVEVLPVHSYVDWIKSTLYDWDFCTDE